MPRLIQHDAKTPAEIKSKDGQSFWICRCGLSRNQPYCDGSHNATADEDENKLYEYDENQSRSELSRPPRPDSVFQLKK